jgi:two-component system response regulator PilR (NtrC family)
MDVIQRPYHTVVSELIAMENDPRTYLETVFNRIDQSETEYLCTSLVSAWASLLIFDPHTSLQNCERILHEATLERNILWKPYYLLVKISALSMLMRLSEMKACLDEVQLTNGKSGDLYCSLLLSVNLAIYNLRKQDILKAELQIQKTAEMLEEVTESYVQADITYRLGSLFAFQRKHDVAMGYFVQCFQLSNRHHYRLKAIQTCTDLIATNAHLGNYARVEKLYRYGLSLSDKLQIPAFAIGLHFNMGLQFKLRGVLHEAIECYLKSLEELKKLEHKIPQTEFNIYNNLGNVMNQTGEHEKALDYQAKALSIAIDTGNVALQMQIIMNMGLTMIGMKRYADALPYFTKPEKYYTKTKNYELLCNVLRSQGLLYQESKDYKRAFKVMEKLDSVHIKLLRQVKNDYSAHSGKLLDTFLSDTQKLKVQLATTQQKLLRFIPETYIGSSPASRKVVSNAMLAAMYPESGVFINGESGTGKEVVAQMIHSHSARREQPYITVNCASISPNLFESEFFGHIRGSFTGASQDKQGFFQLANNGSLFLDEISEMPIEFQAKLLRAIDTKRVIPVGKGKEVKINCKIIASSNHDIHELIKANKFRLDLFHRINTIEILIPPLRERPEDIPELLEHFVHRYALETNKAIPEIRQDFIDKLLRYPFQGNVRELKNIVERIFILFYEPVWGAEILNNLSSFITGDVLPQSRGIADLKNIERGMIIDALKKCNWKQSEAAKLLNLTESTLCRKIKRLQIHK